MAFLTVAGFNLRIARQPSYRWQKVGDLGRGWLNRPLGRWNRQVRVFSFEQIWLPEHCADTWEGLIEGRGHHWSFDADPWSTSGIGPVPGSVFTMIAGGAAIGAGYLEIGGGDNVQFDPKLRPDKWGVCYWRDSTSWEHVIVRSDGAKWVDGVRNDAAATPELTVDAGLIRFDGPLDLDDLTVFNFFPCENFATAFYSWTSAGNAGPDLPKFQIYGDWLEGEDPVTVLGSVSTQRYKTRWNPDGDFRNNYRRAQFELIEV